jgi:hypothetical protein
VDALVIDLLFTTELSVKEIALRVGATVDQVKERITALGLGWVRARSRMSRGHAALYEIMQRLVPGEEIVTEQPIGERLKLDVYCPKYRLAAEYHGQQHFVYVEHFHGNMEGFKDSQRRDARKAELCQQKKIGLIVFDARDPMTEGYVFQQMLDTMKMMDPVEQQRSVKKIDPYLEARKEQQREYRKRVYRQIKEERKL